MKRYYGNKNHWRKANDNWDATISVAQCGFILKSYYIPPDKSNPYACNTSEFAGGYIFKILDLKIPTSDSKQCRDALERFGKDGSKWRGIHHQCMWDVIFYHHFL